MLPTAQGSEEKTFRRLFVRRLVPTEQSNIKKQAPRRMMPKEFKVSSDSLDKCIIFLRPHSTCKRSRNREKGTSGQENSNKREFRKR
jgi:hypothetical protein